LLHCLVSFFYIHFMICFLLKGLLMVVHGDWVREIYSPSEVILIARPPTLPRCFDFPLQKIHLDLHLFYDTKKIRVFWLNNTQRFGSGSCWHQCGSSNPFLKIMDLECQIKTYRICFLYNYFILEQKFFSTANVPGTGKCW
jgi:hypothetical protein